MAKLFYYTAILIGRVTSLARPSVVCPSVTYRLLTWKQKPRVENQNRCQRSQGQEQPVLFWVKKLKITDEKDGRIIYQHWTDICFEILYRYGHTVTRYHAIDILEKPRPRRTYQIVWLFRRLQYRTLINWWILTYLAVLPPVFTLELSSSCLKLSRAILQVLCSKHKLIGLPR